MKKIALTTKEELNIYMSPTRQRLLRLLNMAKEPMTPKMLADKLQISASGVQHHIKKLMQLKLIELDHTEVINGIRASFYKHANVMVQIGLGQSDELAQQKEVLIQDMIAQVYDGFRNQMKNRLSKQTDTVPENIKKWGDILSGVVHLNNPESEELMTLISTFIAQHASPTEDSSPWEYAIIAYNTEDNDD